MMVGEISHWNKVGIALSVLHFKAYLHYVICKQNIKLDAASRSLMLNVIKV